MRIYLLLFVLLPMIGLAQVMPQIYVHTDRGAYFPGDTVWFKAYVMNEGLLDTETHNLYLNIGNPDGIIQQRSVMLLKNGMASGHLVIPRQTISSSLFLNAYTKTTATQPELYYIKAVPLIQESSTVSAEVEGQSNEIFLETYPIGGHFVNGVEGELLVKTSLGGKGISTVGCLTDSIGSLSIPFETDSNGYTRIRLNPGQETHYKIFWTSVIGEHEIMRTLDMNYASSNILIQDIGDDSIRIHIQSSVEADYQVEARINYRKLFSHEVAFTDRGQKNIYLNKSDLEQGIVQVFLRDHSGKLLGRSAHLLGEPTTLSLAPEVNLIEKSPEEKGKNIVSIVLPGEALAYLSVSVTDVQMPVDSFDNIVGDLYLKPFLRDKSSDLKQYLSSKHKLEDLFLHHLKAVDFRQLDQLPVAKDSILYLKGQILMDKNRWTKFYERYNKLISNEKKSRIGQRGASFGYKKAGAKQMVYTEVIPDAKGWFSIPGLTFYDSLETRFSQIYRDLKFDEYKISYHFADVPPLEKLHLPAEGEQGINIGLINNQRYYYGADYYIDNKGMHHIREVPVYRSKKQKRLDALEEQYTRGIIIGKPDYVFDPHAEEDIIKRSMSLEQYLTEKIRRIKYGSIFLNERQLQDGKEINQLLETDMSQFVYIKYYDYVRYHDFGGKATFVYQLEPGKVDRNFGKRIDEQTIGGYLGDLNFQNKMYDKTLERLVSDYDYRPTLYWNPAVTLQQNGQVLTFYNNSRAQGYWITIQGVTASGKLVFYQKKYAN